MLHLLTYFSLAFFKVNSVFADCVPPLGTCSQDCECCGHGTERVLCETRNLKYGPRCYKLKIVGEPCQHRTQCASQVCENGYCKFIPRVWAAVLPDMCRMELHTDEIIPINGHVLEGDGLCPCDVTESSPAGNEVQKLIDGDLNTFYSNDFAIGSGFLWKPSNHFPLQFIILKAQSGKTLSRNVPGCIKVETRCGNDNFNVLHESELIWEGKYLLESVVDFFSSSKRFEFDEMRVTFPCFKGDFPECTSTTTCENYPMQLSEVSFLGKCYETNLCPVEIISAETLVGTYADFQTSCPVCDHGSPSPLQNDASKAFDGTASEYINYFHQNSGVVVQIDPKKPIAGIRLYPGSSGIEFDPSIVEVEGSNDDGNSWSSIFISYADIELPKQRNHGTLSYFFEKEWWSNEQLFDKIRIKFPQIRGPLDESPCHEGELCRDYPIAIGEIGLYTWC